MKFIVQRVSEANVSVDQNIIGEIKRGFLILVGISNTDTKEIADKMVSKLIRLRIFEDSEGKTNLDIKSIDGELLIISQFSLYADCIFSCYRNTSNRSTSFELRANLLGSFL